MMHGRQGEVIPVAKRSEMSPVVEASSGFDVSNSHLVHGYRVIVGKLLGEWVTAPGRRGQVVMIARLQAAEDGDEFLQALRINSNFKRALRVAFDSQHFSSLFAGSRSRSRRVGDVNVAQCPGMSLDVVVGHRLVGGHEVNRLKVA